MSPDGCTCGHLGSPFSILGIDSDNGSAFINHDLLRYCQSERLTFTRCRSAPRGA
jgi:hypothetical protein